MPTKTFLSLNKEKQALIFRIALDEFADYGFSQASTNRICRRAHISKGSMFQYFENKEDLFIYTVQKALKEIINMYRTENITYNDSMDLKEIFNSACLQMIRFYEKLPKHYRLYLRINYEVDYPDFRTIRRYLSKHVTAVTHRFLEIGQAKGIIKKEIRSDLALFFINNMLFRLVEVFFIPGIDPSLNIGNVSVERDEILEEVYQMLIEGMGAS